MDVDDVDAGNELSKAQPRDAAEDSLAPRPWHVFDGYRCGVVVPWKRHLGLPDAGCMGQDGDLVPKPGLSARQTRDDDGRAARDELERPDDMKNSHGAFSGEVGPGQRRRGNECRDERQV